MVVSLADYSKLVLSPILFSCKRVNYNIFRPKMVINVGINGFGRIGRITFRKCFQNNDLQVKDKIYALK